MASKKVTIKGRGPELFGRGIDLLFGEEADGQPDLAMPPNGAEPVSSAPSEWPANTVATAPLAESARETAYLDAANPTQTTLAASPAADSDREAAYLDAASPTQTTLAASPAADSDREAAYLDLASPTQNTPSPVDEYLRPAAEAFIQATAGAADDAAHPATPPNPTLPDYPSEGPVVAELTQTDTEGNTMPTTHPTTPSQDIDAQQPSVAADDRDRRKVGIPSSNGAAGADDSALSADIGKEDGATLTRQEAREIASKLRRSDLNALDREVDALYAKVGTLLSGHRQEATIAFDILRRVRMILLKDPERYADAEYLVNQVRARTNQIERSIEGGRAHAPRIFTYQTIWLVILGFMALATTVNGVTFRAWASVLLGIPLESEQLNWAVLFLSTLAWGGIGGVTCALWSLYHHISVVRDFDPVETLWYYSQPLLGMVLGGIVFLIMGAGFLVVQVDLATQAQSSAALGARLLPAAVAVIAGFRQNMVLELIERIIALIIPGQGEEEKPTLSAYQPPSQQPPEELMI